MKNGGEVYRRGRGSRVRERREVALDCAWGGKKKEKKGARNFEEYRFYRRSLAGK